MPGFLFKVESLIDDEDLIGIRKSKQMGWGSGAEPWPLPRLGCTPDREVSHAQSVRTGHELSVEKDGKIRAVARPYDECSQSFQGSTLQGNFHGGRPRSAYALKLPQSEGLPLGRSIVPVGTVMRDLQLLPGLPVDLCMHAPIRVGLSHRRSVDEDPGSGNSDAGVGFDDKHDGNWSFSVRWQFARCQGDNAQDDDHLARHGHRPLAGSAHLNFAFNAVTTSPNAAFSGKSSTSI